MRISVPGIPQAILNSTSSKPIKSISEAKERLIEFLRPGNVTLLTGAGVSVDSGIRAYRGEDGRYMNPNYKPLFYHELMDSSAKGHTFRQRYWLRSYLGYPPVRDAIPNTTHFSLAALQYTSFITNIITQNVDGLHQKALLCKAGDATGLLNNVLELHGTLHKVHCNKGHVVDRATFQSWLSVANPKWHKYANELERTGRQPRTNPDGDVAVEHLGINYNDFVVPDCPSCRLGNRRNDVQKPAVVFFGESIPAAIKERSHRVIEQGDRLLLIGTTLATYSAFRLLKHAIDLKKPVMLLNVGPTRADAIKGVEKLDVPSGSVMQAVSGAVIGPHLGKHPVVAELLISGIRKPPAPDVDD